MAQALVKPRVSKKSKPVQNNGTKEQLAIAALRLFRRRGYEGANLQDIGRELNITRAAIYYHFKSKDELLYVAHEELINEGLARYAAASRDLQPVEKLWIFVALHTDMQFMHSGPIEGNVVFGIVQLLSSIEDSYAIKLRRLTDKFTLTLRQILEDGVTAGEFDIPNITAVEQAILGMDQRTAVWFQAKGDLSLNQLSEIQGDLAIRMVGAKSPINRNTLCRLLEAVTES